MTTKRFWICVTSFLTLAMVVSVAILGNSGDKKLWGENFVVSGNEPEYEIEFDSGTFSLSELDTDYQELVTQKVVEKTYSAAFKYFLAKLDGDDNLVLAPNGRLYNYDDTLDYDGRITNIKTITVNYTGGALFIQEGLSGEATTYGPKTAIASGSTYTFTTNPNHFMITNSSAETTITDFSITYSCVEHDIFSYNRLGEIYNGKGADSNTYTLTRDGTNVSVAGQTGTISVDTFGNFTMTLAGGTIVYTGTVSADYHTLTFEGKTGTNASLAPDILEMNRVYIMDDFESYADRGTGYTASQLSVFTASNLRGAYWVDAGSGSGNTWVSSSSFKMPSTSNYLNLCTTLKHGGNKSMLLQGQKAGWVRLWSSEVWNQNQHHNFGRGNRLSFWIHSARNNPDGSGVNASDVKIRAQVYYQNFVLTDSNRNSSVYGTGVVVNDKVISSGSDWQEVVINIDPNKTVYAINIMINNSGLATDYVFMPIDDITIYTEPIFERTKKYDESATMITKSYHGTVTVAGQKATVKVALGADGFVMAYAAKDMEATSYSIVGNTITIVTEGSYSGKTFGTWVGTLSNDNCTITIPKSGISGTITEVISSDTIVLNENNILIDGSEGNLAGLEEKVLRQYNDGSWKTDSSNADRLSINTDFYMEGNSSIRVRPYQYGNLRIIMKPSLLDGEHKVDSVGFWFYAPAETTYTINIYAYKTNDATGAYQQCNVKSYSETDPEAAGLSGWHYMESGLYNSNGFGYSFAITINTNAKQTILDYVTYFMA